MQESFAELFEESLGRQEMRPGEVITAEVVRIDHNFVVVNAGLKSESYIEIAEFLSDKGELEVEIAQGVKIMVLRSSVSKPRVPIPPKSSSLS